MDKYEQLKEAGRAQAYKKTVKDFLIELVVACEMQRRKDKKRNYWASTHEFYAQAETAIREAIAKELNGMKKDTYGAAIDIFKAPNIGYNTALEDAQRVILKGRGENESADCLRV